MPQLDPFIFFDGAITVVVVFFIIHTIVVGYILPIWLRSRVWARVARVVSQVRVSVWSIQ